MERPSLAEHFSKLSSEQRRLLVPYVTGGLGDWVRALEAAAAAGGDAVEVGIPFSDPVMDGPTIQEASRQALEAGTTPVEVIEGIAEADVAKPILVMTYYNIVFRWGHERFASACREAGVAGVIVPDLPLEEVGPWASVARSHGLACVLLAAPTADDERLRRICDTSAGFVYAVSLLGVTGERESLASSAMDIAVRLKRLTRLPVLVGVGVSTPEHAHQLTRVADGVVVGSAIVRRILDGDGVDGVRSVVASFRRALDDGGANPRGR